MNADNEDTPKEQKYGKYQYIYDSIEGYLQELNYERAIIQMKKLIFFITQDPELYLELAKYYLLIYDISSAITYVKKALLVSSKNDNIKNSLNDLLFAQGLLRLIGTGQIEFDYEFLGKIKNNIKPSDFYYLRAKAFLALNMVDECVRDLNKLLEIDDSNEQGLILLGKVLMNKGKIKEGENLMWKANKVNPENEEIKQFTKLMKKQMDEVLTKANVHILKGRLKLGLLLAFKALTIYPNHPEALLLRSSIYKSMGMLDESIKDLNLAKESCKGSNNFNSNPNLDQYLKEVLSGIYNDMSVERIKKKNFNDALYYIDEAIKNEPNDFFAHLNKGDCFMKMKDILSAKEEYNNCFEINKESPVARSRLANVYYKLAIFSYNSKDYLEALNLLTNAVSYFEKYDFIFVLKARTEIKLGMVQEAYNDASLAYLINPNNQDAIEIRKYLC